MLTDEDVQFLVGRFGETNVERAIRIAETDSMQLRVLSILHLMEHADRVVAAHVRKPGRPKKG